MLLSGLMIACVALLLGAGVGSAQRVTVSRSGLARRLPIAMDARVATVTAEGSDSLAVGANITVDRSRFLAFRTAEGGLAELGMLQGPVLAAFPTGPRRAPSDSTQSVPGQVGTTTADPGSGEYIVLPWRFMTADAVGTGLWSLRPVFQLARPLRRDAAADVFRGSFYLAMEDSASRGTSKPLTVPIRLRVTTDADSLTPETLEFTQTNFPLHEVVVASARASDSVRVRIIPEFDLRGVDMWLPVEPGIVIESAGRTLAGLGIETAPVTVSVRGARLEGPVTVHLETDRGSLEPEVITIGAEGLASARIRSAGTGDARIRAFAQGLGEDVVTYRFTWPVAFLLAALLGGVAGGLGAAVMKKRVTRAGLRRALTRGLVLGLLAAVIYYAIGISLLQVDLGVARFNESAVFAFAALAGLLGLRLPEALGKG
jgi:hypothetical protein